MILILFWTEIWKSCPIPSSSLASFIIIIIILIQKGVYLLFFTMCQCSRCGDDDDIDFQVFAKLSISQTKHGQTRGQLSPGLASYRYGGVRFPCPAIAKQLF